MNNKTIHYCWFGRGKKPELAKRCIASWHKFLPDYEIKEWNEDNFDIEIIPYTREAYEEKKYAFVSDYARFWILYHYGGVYFDVDVELIKPMSNIIEGGPFMACENDELMHPFNLINPGLGIYAEKGMPIYEELLKCYLQEHFLNADKSLNLKTIVTRTTDILIKYGYKQSNDIQKIAGLLIYPHDYMCPIRIVDGKKTITQNTISIHHYAASWTTPRHRFIRSILVACGGLKLRALLYSIIRKE